MFSLVLSQETFALGLDLTGTTSNASRGEGWSDIGCWIGTLWLMDNTDGTSWYLVGRKFFSR